MATVPEIVTSTADSGADTLRSAILFANAHPGTTITFAGDALTNPIALTRSLPMITANVTIDGGGGVTIDAQDSGRVFFVASGTVAINDVTIANAHGPGRRRRRRCPAGGTAARRRRRYRRRGRRCSSMTARS